MLSKFLAVIIGYLFGNFISAMFVGKYYLHKDPTKYGSGNPGTANMGAVFGKKAGILTCIGDLLKTMLAICLVYAIYHQHLLTAYTGLGVVLGHCFSVFNHFKGGKAVAGDGHGYGSLRLAGGAYYSFNSLGLDRNHAEPDYPAFGFHAVFQYLPADQVS